MPALKAQHADLDWFIGSAEVTSVNKQRAAGAWLDTLPR